MILRKILNYLKNRKAAKDLQWLNEYVESHPVEKTEPSKIKEKEYNDISLKLNLADSIDLLFGNDTYALSREYTKSDWEEDDIVKSKSITSTVLIHPLSFFEYVISNECVFLKNQKNDFIENISNATWFSFGYLDDSRDYPSIAIENKKTTIKNKYLCPTFYISNINDEIILIVDNLLDEKMDEVPKIITTVSNDIFTVASAAYNDEEELWQYINA